MTIQFFVGNKDQSTQTILKLLYLPVNSEAGQVQCGQVVEMGHKNVASRLVGVTVNRSTPISDPCFLHEWMLAMDETVPDE